MPVKENLAGSEWDVRQTWKYVKSVMATIGFMLAIRWRVITPYGNSTESSHEALEKC